MSAACISFGPVEFSVSEDHIPVGDTPREHSIIVENCVARDVLEKIRKQSKQSKCVVSDLGTFLMLESFERLDHKVCTASHKYTLIPAIKKLINKWGIRGFSFTSKMFYSSVKRLFNCGLISEVTNSTYENRGKRCSKVGFSTLYGKGLNKSFDDKIWISSRSDDFNVITKWESRKTSNSEPVVKPDTLISIVDSNGKIARLKDSWGRNHSWKGLSSEKFCCYLLKRFECDRKSVPFHRITCKKGAKNGKGSTRVEFVDDDRSLCKQDDFLKDSIYACHESKVHQVDYSREEELLEPAHTEVPSGSLSTLQLVECSNPLPEEPIIQKTRKLTVFKTKRVSVAIEKHINPKGISECFLEAENHLFGRQNADKKHTHLCCEGDPSFTERRGPKPSPSTVKRRITIPSGSLSPRNNLSSCCDISFIEKEVKKKRKNDEYLAPKIAVKNSLSGRQKEHETEQKSPIFFESFEDRSDLDQAIFWLMFMHILVKSPYPKEFFKECTIYHDENLDRISEWLWGVSFDSYGYRKNHIRALMDVVLDAANLPNLFRKNLQDVGSIVFTSEMGEKLFTHLMLENELFSKKLKPGFFFSVHRYAKYFVGNDDHVCIMKELIERYLRIACSMEKSVFKEIYAVAKDREQWRKKNLGTEWMRIAILIRQSLVDKIRNRLLFFQIRGREVAREKRKECENSLLEHCKNNREDLIKACSNVRIFAGEFVAKTTDLEKYMERVYGFCFKRKYQKKKLKFDVTRETTKNLGKLLQKKERNNTATR